MFKNNESIVNISSSDEEDGFGIENDLLGDRKTNSDNFLDFSPERENTQAKFEKSSTSPISNYLEDNAKILPDSSPKTPKKKIDHSEFTMDFEETMLQQQDLDIDSPNNTICTEFEKSVIKKVPESMKLIHRSDENVQYGDLRAELSDKFNIKFDTTIESEVLLSKIKDIFHIIDHNTKSKPQLLEKSDKMKSMYIEILEIYAQFLDNIPSKVLCELPEFNQILFENTKAIRDKLKLELYLIANKIDNLDQKPVSNVSDDTFNDSNITSIPNIDQNNSVNNSINYVEDINNKLNHQKVFKFKSPAIKSSLSKLNDNVSRSANNIIPSSSFTSESTSMTHHEFEDDDIFAREINLSTDAASSTFGNVFKPKELVPKTSQPSKFKLDVSNKSTDSKNDTSNFREIKKQPQRLEEFGVGFKSSITTDGWLKADHSKPIKDCFQKASELKSNDSCKLSESKTIHTSTKPQNNQLPLGQFRIGTRNDATTGEFDGMNFDHTQEMMTIFREIFGLKSFRTNQRQVINAILLGHDCFVLMPTGGGKSLCYQLPALLKRGVTVVISPLKSLILDQVNKMDTLDIPADHISGDVTEQHYKRVYDDLNSSNPKIKLLYVTPERIISSNKLQDTLHSLYKRGFLAKFVIDEAHCVSQWGHDFRPDYKKLSLLRTNFPETRIMALTATATPRVRQDILNQLKLKDCRWFLCSFNRPNLKYVVLPKKSGPTMMKGIESLIKSKYQSVSGIIYCLSRNDCDDMAQKLTATGIKAAPYHAGMSDKSRESTQKSWLTNKINVICATIAFGMGIDKPDVRFVIHSSLPKSIEGYYQESGRAGRDGELAICILYYAYSDMHRLRKMMDKDPSRTFESKQIHMNNLKRIVGYCENVTDCRRSQQLDYFAEIFDRDNCKASALTACDNCEGQGQYKVVDVTEDCIAIVNAVKDLCSGKCKFTLLHMSEVFKGACIKKITDFKHDKCALYGRGKSWNRADVLRLFHKMVIEEYLSEEIVFFNDIPNAYLRLGPNAGRLMKGDIKIELSIKCKQKQVVNATKAVASGTTEHDLQLKHLADRCYSDLLDVCRSIASEKNITMASVINMQALKIMSERLPETEADMMSIPHVTRANFEKFGKRFLEVTLKYTAEKLCLLMDLQDAADGSDQRPDVPDNFSYSDDNEDSLENMSETSMNTRKRKPTFSSGPRKRFRGRPKRQQVVRGGRKSWGSTSKSSQNSKSTTSSSKYFLSAPSSFKM